MLNRRNAFNEMNVRSPRFAPAELGFYQVVTWLYTYYYEAGRESLRFLMSQFPAQAINHQCQFRRHYGDINRLRTYLQHNLNLDSERDMRLQQGCHEWFSRNCGSAIPQSDEEWVTCLQNVLSAASDFLQALIDCVRGIERDESRQMISGQWCFRIDRYHPKHQFEQLVAIVIHDIGQDALDPTRLTDRYYERWTHHLHARSSDYVFEQEGRRLIEQTILAEKGVLSPLSSEDIMKEFGIGPGRRVGELLETSIRIYLNHACTTEELLEFLKKEVGWGQTDLL